MAKKMYYSEEETAEKLGIPTEELTKYVRDQKLRLFKDGSRNMFKADEVDALAAEGADEEIELSPADTNDGDLVVLSDTDEQPATTASKEDTVITAEGISVFDEEDLEIEAADPMAETHVATEGVNAFEGAGGGSGLL